MSGLGCVLTFSMHFAFNPVELTLSCVFELISAVDKMHSVVVLCQTKCVKDKIKKTAQSVTD